MKHIHKNTKLNTDILNHSYRYDPSQTLTLRNRFSRKMRKRWRAVRGAVREAIVNRDVFGLQDNINTQQIDDIYLPQYNAFAFESDQDKIEAFIDWLRQITRAGILDIKAGLKTSDNINTNWTDTYIEQSYRQGVQRAYRQLKNAGYDIPDIEEMGGIAAVVRQITHSSKMGSMRARTYRELEGITDDFFKKTARVLSQDLAENKSASGITDDINGIVKGGGVSMLGNYVTMERRAEMTARTETIRSHNWGQLQTYENWEMEEVKVQVEWVTAGQNVCPLCLDMEGSVYNIDESWGLLPAHALCKCIFLPI